MARGFNMLDIEVSLFCEYALVLRALLLGEFYRIQNQG